MPEPLTAALMKTAGEGIAKLLLDYGARTLESAPQRLAELKSNVGPHIEEIYEKCSHIKTLLNPQTPVAFLSIYATQRFIVNNKIRDQYDMVDLVKKNIKNLIITGTGGSGKSMFTRYLWLSLFLDSGGRIPLFVELRNLNNLSSPDIMSYVYHTIISGKATLSEKSFRQKLERGDFILILDGFDEVSDQKRPVIQQAIIYLSEVYSDMKIILTSRPDSNFASWPKFDVVIVAPLQKYDVVELIDKSNFHEEPKRRFKKQIESNGLFEKHESFLANPLLASMMLLTYSQNFDIPDKMHLFYEQAFDALYQRHDRHKPGDYKREFRTKLNEDDFKRLLSYFCLFTYFREEFSFTNDSAIRYIVQSAKMTGLKVNAEEFLQDLCSCVCILVQEGLYYVFSHRSFQEYFAAYCLSYITSENYAEFILSFGRRPEDQTVNLLSDMNPDRFRKHFVIPLSNLHENVLQLHSKERSVAQALWAVEQEFVIEWYNVGASKRPMSGQCYISMAAGSEASIYIAIIASLASRKGASRDPKSALKRATDQHTRDRKAARELFEAMSIDERYQLRVGGNHDALAYRIENSKSMFRAENNEVPKKIYEGPTDVLDLIFSKSYMYEFVLDRLAMVSAYVNVARKTQKVASNALAEMMKLD